MTTSTALTLRLPKATAQRLAALATSTARTRSRLAAEAIEKFLDDNAWQVEAIEAGVRSADAGEVTSHAAVVTWVKGWTKARKQKLPR